MQINNENIKDTTVLFILDLPQYTDCGQDLPLSLVDIPVGK
ncbi:hypothetical protein ymoll0001_19000 [Yersinia mollaretii ATCC 43969]|uniref:Uncharacterized protein n=1 Tax=Yersinia mollaretii (strain ATCC 43969 / DSM 18520 / CIP 103324 / CNY 7263 / WAIP 204) TaxID=349967 RepID=A0ABM9Y9V1_YERMW|nr:hypothetical protein ymoll0001_19000 [Yersinia mollaretii ATCC 43969]